ncbi:hypothetical protein Q1695_005457 [Nippostrongylus brasiliensis]|nr:hypothetical protein Q1695_005457 [Nippostrongylus brasiliensis]
MSAEQVSMDDSEAQQSTTTPESVTMKDKKNQLTQVMPSKRRKNSDDASHASQGSSEITNIDKQTGLKQKRKREQPKSSELDEYAEVSFWQRVINSPDCKWPVINRTLEHLNTQWTKRKQVAAGIVTKWRSIMVSKDSATEEQKQDEILKLLMNARDEKERLATIGSRFIAMSLIHKDQAKQAGITEQQLDREIRTTIKEMEKECETLEALLETMQNEHKKSIQKQRIHAHEIESERDDIWDQLQQLLAEKSRWDETLKELQAHRDHWRMRAAEEEQYEEKLKTRMQELQNELDAAANKNKAVQEDLNKRMQELEQQCMHLNSQLTKPTSSRAQQEPTTERKQLSSNPVLDSNQPARNENAEELRRKIRQLERDLDRLEEAKRVPVRMLREHSEKMDPTLLCAFCSRRGLHYTDSCPTYVEPTRRREIVARSGRCRKCLDFCDERGYCANEHKAC